MAVTALTAAPVAAAEQPKPKSIEYTVVEGDYLDKVAQEHGTTWNRLWNKNGFISNPDLIHPGEKIMIPTADEVVPERALPAPVAVAAPAPVVVPQSTAPETFSAAVRGSGGPNAYAYGYCTWYVKNLRPDIGSYWGDGDNWPASARAAGYSVGSQPRAGAIGSAVAYNHVVYVNSVNADGSVNISEMNYQGWNVASSRTASASEFVYIY